MYNFYSKKQHNMSNKNFTTFLKQLDTGTKFFIDVIANV